MSIQKNVAGAATPKMRPLKRAMIKEELVALTGDAIDALLLNYFLFCQSRSRTIEQYLVEERQRMLELGEEMNVPRSNGWFYKRATEVSQETMLGLSDSNIRRRITRLVKRGWIAERRNSHHKWDRTLQYRANLTLIESELREIGYHLDGWMIERVRPDDDGGDDGNGRGLPAPSSDLEVGEEETMFQESESQFSTFKTEVGSSNSELQNVGDDGTYQGYPYKEIHTRKTNNSIQAHSAKMFVADENFSNSDLAPAARTPEGEAPVETVRKKLLNYIELRKIKADAEEIDELLQKWPAANLSDAELLGALVGDYELYALDKPADENIARAAIKANGQRLRWFLCIWPAFEEAGDAYHQRTGHRWTKAQCFWKRWKTAQPPANWLEGELKALRAAKSLCDAETRAKLFQSLWEALKPLQRHALDKEALEILNQDGRGEYFTRSSDEFVLKRQQMLLLDDTRQWLAELLEHKSRSTATAGGKPVLGDDSGASCGNSESRNGADNGKFDDGADDHSDAYADSRSDDGADSHSDAYADGCSDAYADDEEDKFEFGLPSRQLSIEVYIGPILNQIRDKTVTLLSLEDVRPNLLDDAEWGRVKDEAVRRAYAEKIVA